MAATFCLANRITWWFRRGGCVSLRLLSYNIRFGGIGREQALAEVIKAAAPDLVVFQEATHPDVIERIAKETGFPFWAARRNHSIGFLSAGSCVSRVALSGRRASLVSRDRSRGTEARVFGLHLSARFSKWDERRRAREIRSLLEGIKRHQDGFHVLVGDFNTLAPGEVLEMDRCRRGFAR
jgi:endonuclease/exonuclease/phosphatase family metal-dependent hydrolase